MSFFTAENAESAEKRSDRLCALCPLCGKFNVIIDRDEDGVWGVGVECPAIPGCVSQGKTKEEALKNIKEAIKVCLEVRMERGLPLTVEMRAHNQDGHFPKPDVQSSKIFCFLSFKARC